MWSNKFLAVILMLFIFYSGSLFAKEKVRVSDVIAATPACHVITETLNIYSPDSGGALENLFLNYSNATIFFTRGDVEQTIISLLFNEFSAKRRKDVVKHIADQGLDMKFFRKMYEEINCDLYVKVIGKESFSL